MTQYADHIITPHEMKAAHLMQIYAAVNRGLSDSYAQGYALLANHGVMTPDGPTRLTFNTYDFELVKQWLTETGYTMSQYNKGQLFKERPADLEIWRVTWPVENE